ncbi:hypothetical protein VNO78_22251 [Psophocarpus tetragonolobus]|uniref:Uncharacterized protein n=1 Tax=Psophocarpus tetragonolobus TaxID=3891 RepID=A0AAN9SC86_PSOTE
MTELKIEIEKNIKNLVVMAFVIIGRNADWVVEQFLQVERFTQTRSLLMTATRRRHYGRDPRQRSTKYLPEPVATLEVRRECGGEERSQGCRGGLCDGVRGV